MAAVVPSKGRFHGVVFLQHSHFDPFWAGFTHEGLIFSVHFYVTNGYSKFTPDSKFEIDQLDFDRISTDVA